MALVTAVVQVQSLVWGDAGMAKKKKKKKKKERGGVKMGKKLRKENN